MPSNDAASPSPMPSTQSPGAGMLSGAATSVGGNTARKPPRPPSNLGKRQRVIVIDSDGSDFHSTDDERDVLPLGNAPSSGPTTTPSTAPAVSTSTVSVPSATAALPAKSLVSPTIATPTSIVGTPVGRQANSASSTNELSPTFSYSAPHSGAQTPTTPMSTGSNPAGKRRAGRPRGSGTPRSTSSQISMSPKEAKKVAEVLSATPSPFPSVMKNQPMTATRDMRFNDCMRCLVGHPKFDKSEEVDNADWVTLYRGEMVFEGLSEAMKARVTELEERNKETGVNEPSHLNPLDEYFHFVVSRTDSLPMKNTSSFETMAKVTLAAVEKCDFYPYRSSTACFRAKPPGNYYTYHYRGDDVVVENFVVEVRSAGRQSETWATHVPAMSYIILRYFLPGQFPPLNECTSYPYPSADCIVRTCYVGFEQMLDHCSETRLRGDGTPSPPGLQVELMPFQQELLTRMLRQEREGTRDYVQLQIPGQRTTMLFCPLTGDIRLVKQTLDDHDAIVATLNPLVRGGILMEEMGMGKTVCCIAAITASPAPPITKKNCAVPVPRYKQHFCKVPATATEAKQAAEYINIRRRVKTTLIVVPVSITGQWIRELERFNPKLRVVLLHGPARSTLTEDDVAKFDVVVTTYETLKSDCKLGTLGDARAAIALSRSVAFDVTQRYVETHENADGTVESIQRETPYRSTCMQNTARVFSTFHFHRIILDECQKIANTAQSIDVLSADCKWAVTGTPFAQSYDNLRGYFTFLGSEAIGRPAMYRAPNFWTLSCFADRYVERSDICYNQPYLQAMCRQVLRHYAIRHNKAIFASQALLPPKHEETVFITLNDDERKLHDKTEERIRAQFGDLQRQNVLGYFMAKVSSWVRGMRCMALNVGLVRTMAAANLEDVENAVAMRQARMDAKLNDLVFDTPAAVFKKIQAEKGQALPEFFEAVMRELMEVPPTVPECVVCMDEMAKPVVLPCLHMNCQECVMGLLNTRGAAATCPTCRAPNIRTAKHALKIVAEDIVCETKSDEVMEMEELLRRVGNGSKARAMAQSVVDERTKDQTAKFIVFSSFPAFLGIVQQELASRSIKSIVIDGSTTLAKRNKLIGEFQEDPKCTVCMLSSRAGNSGLTLTAANFVYLCEPNLTRHVEQQSIGRAHRFGQTREVTVRRFVVKDTIEERINKLVELGLAQSLGASSKDGDRMRELTYLLLGTGLDQMSMQQPGSPAAATTGDGDGSVAAWSEEGWAIEQMLTLPGVKYNVIVDPYIDGGADSEPTLSSAPHTGKLELKKQELRKLHTLYYEQFGRDGAGTSELLPWEQARRELEELYEKAIAQFPVFVVKHKARHDYLYSKILAEVQQAEAKRAELQRRVEARDERTRQRQEERAARGRAIAHAFATMDPTDIDLEELLNAPYGGRYRVDTDNNTNPNSTGA